MGILRTNEISGLETPTAVTGSVSFDGSGDYLSLADGPDLELGNGDFTIEGWFYFENTGSSGTNFWGKWNSPNRSYAFSYVKSTGTYIFGYSTDGSAEVLLTSDALSADTRTWIHIAAVRSGSSLKVYKNGTAIINSSVGTATFYNATTDLYIGRLQSNTNYDYDGYISNFRILKGTALYTSDFTPPVHELQRIGDTVLLCCNNPDSAGAEATGKTITVNGNAAASTVSPGLTRDFTFGTQFQGVAKFDTQGYFVPPSGTTEQRGRGRGIFGGGTASPGSSNLNSIEFITISTQGNAQDFGDLLVATRTKQGGGVSSPTRGVTAGGFDTGNVSRIEYITIATTGNAIDFGNTLTVAGRNLASASNSTRGLFAGGDNRLTTIDFLTIASLGTVSSFGSLPSPGRSNLAGCASPTRALFGGGYSGGALDTIEYVTIATTGSLQDFGNLTVARFDPSACSSSTRGIFAGGYATAPISNFLNIIDYVTIASTGNAQDFGDLITVKLNPAGTSNSIRGVFAGGSPSYVNTIEFITIASTGNAQDFGDLVVGRGQAWSCSDSHGGLS